MYNTEKKVDYNFIYDKNRKHVFYGTIKYNVEGKDVLMYHDGTLYSEKRILTLKKQFTEFLKLADNTIECYKENGDFSNSWNEQHKQFLENIRLEEQLKEDQRRLEENEGYVYLMHDITSDTHKIGYSRQPKIRESTLRSMNPSASIIFMFKGGLADEEKLHKFYKPYKLRGEWFKFPENILNEVIDYFKSNSLVTPQ